MSEGSEGWIHRSGLKGLEGSPCKSVLQTERVSNLKVDVEFNEEDVSPDSSVPFFQAIGRSRLQSEEELKEEETEVLPSPTKHKDVSTPYYNSNPLEQTSSSARKRDANINRNNSDQPNKTNSIAATDQKQDSKASIRSMIAYASELAKSQSVVSSVESKQQSSLNLSHQESMSAVDSTTHTSVIHNTSSISDSHRSTLSGNPTPKVSDRNSIESKDEFNPDQPHTRRTLREHLRRERAKTRELSNTPMPKVELNIPKRVKGPSSRILSLYNSAKRKQEKLDKRREDTATEGCTFAPQITKKASRKVYRGNKSRFEQLYSNAGRIQNRLEAKRKKREEECTFKPESFTRNSSHSRVGSNEPVHNVLFRRAKRIQDKLEAKRKQVPDECTFSPTITLKASKLESNVHNRSNWDPEQLKKKKEALEHLRVETELQGCTFTPTLNHNHPQNAKLYEKALKNGAGLRVFEQRDGPVHIRLHRFEQNKLERIAKMVQERLRQDVAECTFRPNRPTALREPIGSPAHKAGAKPDLASLFYRLHFNAEEQQRRKEELQHEHLMLITNGGFRPNGRDAVWNPERIERLFRYGTDRLFDNLIRFKDPAWRHSLDLKQEQEDLAHCTFHPKITTAEDEQEFDEDGNRIDRFDRLYQDAIEKRARLEDYNMMLDVEATMLQSRVYSAQSVKLFQKLDDQRAVSPTREKSKLLEMERQTNEFAIASSPRREEMSGRYRMQLEFQDAARENAVPQVIIPEHGLRWGNSKYDPPTPAQVEVEDSPVSDLRSVGETVELETSPASDAVVRAVGFQDTPIPEPPVPGSPVPEPPAVEDHETHLSFEQQFTEDIIPLECTNDYSSVSGSVVEEAEHIVASGPSEVVSTDNERVEVEESVTQEQSTSSVQEMLEDSPEQSRETLSMNLVGQSMHHEKREQQTVDAVTATNIALETAPYDAVAHQSDDIDVTELGDIVEGISIAEGDQSENPTKNAWSISNSIKRDIDVQEGSKDSIDENVLLEQNKNINDETKCLEATAQFVNEGDNEAMGIDMLYTDPEDFGDLAIETKKSFVAEEISRLAQEVENATDTADDFEDGIFASDSLRESRLDLETEAQVERVPASYLGTDEEDPGLMMIMLNDDWEAF